MTSTLNGVASIIDGIDARLAELAPLIDEYNQLQAARAVLTDADLGAAPASGGRARGARASRSARPAAAGRRAPRGANRAAILAFVGANPGATVAQISDATGIAKPTLHSTVYGLKRRGELQASGDGVELAADARSTSARRAPRRAASGRGRGRRAATRRRGTGTRRARRSAPARAAAPTGSTETPPE